MADASQAELRRRGDCWSRPDAENHEGMNPGSPRSHRGLIPSGSRLSWWMSHSGSVTSRTSAFGTQDRDV